MKVNEFIDWCNVNLTEEQKEYEMYFDAGYINLLPTDSENLQVSDEQEIIVL